METLKLALIDPNPFRDLKKHPIDAIRVEDIADSYQKHGDWGGIAVRVHPRKPGRYQRAFGEHRCKAAAEAGLKEINVTIGTWTDQDMADMLIAENATQQGMNAACTLESVWVAAKVIAKAVLATDGDARNLASLRKVLGSKLSQGQIRASILAGNGLGEKLIASYPWQKSLSTFEIQAAVNQLRDSGAWVDLLMDLKREFEEEGDTEAANAIAKNLSMPATANKKPVFDRETVGEFANTSQAEEFRKAVTSDTGRLLVPVEKQMELAKAVVVKANEARAGVGKKKDLKSIGREEIRTHANAEIGRGKIFRDNLGKTERRLLAKQHKEKVAAQELHKAVETFNNGVGKAYSAGSEIERLAAAGTVINLGSDRKTTLTNETTLARFIEMAMRIQKLLVNQNHSITV